MISHPKADFCVRARVCVRACVSQQADKTIQSASGGFGFFSNKEQKYQDAADLYVQAANAFRMQEASQFFFLLRSPSSPFPALGCFWCVCVCLCWGTCS